MDKMEFQQIDELDRVGEAEFAALFDQLDRAPPAALIERGLEQLCRAMAETRRREEINRR